MEYIDFLEMLVVTLAVALIFLFVLYVMQSNTISQLCDEVKRKRMPLAYKQPEDIVGSVLDERRYNKGF